MLHRKSCLVIHAFPEADIIVLDSPLFSYLLHCDVLDVLAPLGIGSPAVAAGME